MIAVDTSVAVAAFSSWHEAHGAALAVVQRGARLPLHAALESYSVLTRLPPPHRAAPALVEEYLALSFPHPFLTVPAGAGRRLLRAVAEGGLTGGAVYDALIGTAARHARATLVSRDRRAVAAYELVGATYELLA